MQSIDWSKKNIAKIGTEPIITEESFPCLVDGDMNGFNESTKKQFKNLREKIEPWLTALFQSEHLSLLIGTGLTTGVTSIAKCKAPGMEIPSEINIYRDEIKKRATESANKMNRGAANCEDFYRCAFEVLAGMKIINDPQTNTFNNELNSAIISFINKIINGETLFRNKLEESSVEAELALLYLKSFLMSFSSRTASRERLNIFTTNYDRFIEYALDDAGIFWLDRFFGKLKPIFRNIRLELDYHYNPPGIRGEPRYVEGVVRFTKLHGSIDWAQEKHEIIRMPWPFGYASSVNPLNGNALDKIIIYPNAAKDIETTFYPYAELFRDFASSICRPNSVIVTYGYGFGDDHINRVLSDALTIPSAHLCVISFDNASGRIENFLKNQNFAQVTLLMGNHFGELKNLVDNYLPKPAIDRISKRMAEIKKIRKEADVENTNEEAGIEESTL